MKGKKTKSLSILALLTAGQMAYADQEKVVNNNLGTDVKIMNELSYDGVKILEEIQHSDLSDADLKAIKLFLNNNRHLIKDEEVTVKEAGAWCECH